MCVTVKIRAMETLHRRFMFQVRLRVDFGYRVRIEVRV